MKAQTDRTASESGSSYELAAVKRIAEEREETPNALLKASRSETDRRQQGRGVDTRGIQDTQRETR